MQRHCDRIHKKLLILYIINWILSNRYKCSLSKEPQVYTPWRLFPRLRFNRPSIIISRPLRPLTREIGSCRQKITLILRKIRNDIVWQVQSIFHDLWWRENKPLSYRDICRCNCEPDDLNFAEAVISKSPMEVQARKKPLELNCNVPGLKPGM